MNWKYIFRLSLVAAALTLVGCAGEDEASRFNPADVSAAPFFTDERDGHLYATVRIGDRVWMAENMAYFVEGGASAGCYVYGESAFDMSKLTITLDSATFVKAYDETVMNEDHDWTEEIGLPASSLATYIAYFKSGMYSQKAFVDMFKSYTAFYEALKATMAAYGQEQVRQYARIHSEEADRSFGGYVEQYGYLYSLDGARAAVPEGWRIPTDEDWKALEKVLGMDEEERDALNAWRGQGLGTLLKEGGASGFNARMGGCFAYLHANENNFIRAGQCGYWWTDEEYTDTQQSEEGKEGDIELITYRMGIVRETAIFSDAVWRGTTRIDNTYRGMAYSLRCCRDAQ